MPGYSYDRILSDFRHVGYFVKNVLEIRDDDDFCGYSCETVITRVASAEKQLKEIVGRDTLSSVDNRFPKYSSDESRERLREKIFTDLITMVRLDNDDDISMGKGGLLPKTPLLSEKKAFVVIGLPASGKSGVASVLSDKFGAMILDPDYAKRKIPEFKCEFGATLVHEESSLIIFGTQNSKEQNVLLYAVKNGYNIVIPKIGSDSEKIQEFADYLHEIGYTVHLVLVRLDRAKAVSRACKRFLDTGRYVPLSLVFDVYGNNPTITYYDLKRMRRNFKSFTMISSDVGVKESKIILDISKKSPITEDLL